MNLKHVFLSVVTLGGYYWYMKHKAKQLAMYANPQLQVNENIPFEPATLLKYLGGKENVREVSASFSKLTVLVSNKAIVDMAAIKNLGSTGAFESGNIISFMFGSISKPLCQKIKALIE